MASELTTLSNQIAAVVERVAPSVVAVDARRRFPSSGAVWQDGVIVTAEHAVQREEEIKVVLPDGRTAPATLAGRDPGTDLAVLRADTGGLAAAPRAVAGTPKPGHLIVTVGRGGDGGASAAMGIVSSVVSGRRTWRGGYLERIVRLDVSMYPASSGAAVADSEGLVIGLATGALSRTHAFAIPPETIDRVVGELLREGRIKRGYIGVGMQPIRLPEAMRAKLKLADDGGLIVLFVEPQGPAEAAGVLVGDIVVALGGRSVSDTDDVQAALGGDVIGRAIAATIVRGGEVIEAPVTVRERPAKEA